MFYPHFFCRGKKTNKSPRIHLPTTIHIQKKSPRVVESQDPEDRPDAELLLDILGTCSSESSGTPPMLPLFLERFKEDSSRDGGMETGDRRLGPQKFGIFLRGCKRMNVE